MEDSGLRIERHLKQIDFIWIHAAPPTPYFVYYSAFEP